MNKLKPIEEGCMAISIHCEIKSNNGKFIIVGKCLGEITGFTGGVMWEVDRPMKTTKGSHYLHLPELYLMRIDDPDLKEEKEEELVYIEDKNHV